MKKRISFAGLFLLSAVLLLFMLCGCKNKSGDPSDNGNEYAPDGIPGVGSVVVAEDGRRMLTGIYCGEDIALPDGMTLSSAVRPDYDPETGVLRVLATCRVTETVSDGKEEFEFPVDRFSVVTLFPDGSFEELPVPLHWSGFVACGAFEKDGLRYVGYDQSSKQLPRVTLNRMRNDGTVTELPVDVESYFKRGYPDRMFLFPNGDTLYVLQKEAVLVGEDGFPKASADAAGDIQDAGMTADGKIYATWNAGRGAVLSELDPENGGFGPVIETESAAAAERGTTVTAVRFGPGYDFYYIDEGGVRGADFEGDSFTSEPLLNFLNSGLNRALESFIAPLSPEAMVFRNIDDEAFLYSHSPDLDLADLKILTVGCDSTHSIPAMFASAVSAFQKAHPDVRIVTKDYVGYDNKEKPDGGEQQLAMELVTGLFKPDLLIGPGDAEYMTQAREKGLYRDLAPSLAKDGGLFGCIERLYDDGKGGMWGIAPSFSVRTVFADPARLGKYAGQGYLSPTDFIDLAESLGEDKIAAADLWRGIYSFNWLLYYGNGYRAFLDRDAGTASFDSPEFLRVLRYLADLPTSDEARLNSPFADMDQADRIYAQRNGDILFTEVWGSWMWVQPELWTGTEEWIMIGHPTGDRASGTGSIVEPSLTLLVTTYCAETELADEFLAAVLRIAEEADGGHFPALKSAFRGRAQEKYGEVYALFYSGGAGVWNKDDKGVPKSEDDLSEPGVLTEFTPEKAARLEAMLDEAGAPIRLADDEAVLEIVRDEVMSFLSGVGTAEDCAKKIQSRASLWLAEKK